MVFTIYNLVEAVWIIIPAFAANGLVPLMKGRHPVDGGRKFIDGKPIFGEGKTWEGFLFGCFFGAVIGLVEQLAFPYLPFDISPVPLTIVPMTWFLGLIIGLGAMMGDLVASFFKRRIGLKRGKPAPILDQDDFVLGSLLFACLFVPVKIEWAILLLIITPPFHLTANRIAYWLKVKQTPY
jgi:CDP-2,3-bis-(O-geranylgeranyl)-sn-glycerol synthase